MTEPKPTACPAVGADAPGKLLMMDANMLDHRFTLDGGLNLAHMWKAGKVAVVEVRGRLEKYCCHPHSATASIEQSLQMAANDADVKRVIVRVDSPGGSWLGVGAVVNAIRRCSVMGKPTTGVVSDLALSGGFWIASACDRLVANREAVVGGIGAYAVLTDFSDADKKFGIKRVTVASTEKKGLGADGGVTEELIDETQMLVNRLHDLFVQDVRSGRKGWDGTRADGTAIPVEDALKIGLIDAVENFDSVMARVQGEVMAEEQQTPATGTPKPPETPPVVAGQIAGHVKQEDFDKLVKTVETLTAGIKAKDDEILKAKTESLNTILTAARVNGFNITASTLEDAVKQVASMAGLTDSQPEVADKIKTSNGPAHPFIALVERIQKDEKVSKADAVMRAAKRDPKVHAEFITHGKK